MFHVSSFILYILLFVLGLAVGSFLNVIAFRYQPGQKILDKKTIGGRSRCPVCHQQLVWYELIPILSFLIQKGRCRHCGHKISLQYPLIEILSGLIFVSVPWHLGNFYQVSQISLIKESIGWYYWLVLIWILIFLLFLLLSIIDFRYSVIPNQINLVLAVLGIFLITLNGYYHKFAALGGSFLGHYAILFGFRENILINYLLAALLGIAFLGAIIFLSKGKAMGWGDLKLIGALGLILGWPDILMALFLAFIVGGLTGLILIMQRKKKMKDAISFGPFLAIGASLTFFFGYHIINWYFQIFNLQ